MKQLPFILLIPYILLQEDVDRILAQLDTERKQMRQHKYDWIDADETVPPGWKLRVVEGKTRKTFFLSEDGCQFACRRSALQYLINSDAPSAAVEAMRAKLRHEGWLDDPLLPPGWKVRKAEGSTNGMFDVNYYYLAKDGTMFHSTRAVVNFMKKSADYTEADIGRIKARLESETRKNRPQKYVWHDDPLLPAGWRYRTIIKAGIRTDFVLTEAGAQFQSRRAAIEHMIKENFPPQAIFRWLYTTFLCVAFCMFFPVKSLKSHEKGACRYGTVAYEVLVYRRGVRRIFVGRGGTPWPSRN